MRAKSELAVKSILTVLIALAVLASPFVASGTRVQAAPADSPPWQGSYKQVFPSFTAEGINLDSEGRLTIYGSKVQVSGAFQLPAEATTDTAFDLSVAEADWQFVAFQDLSLKTADGTAVATASANATTLTIVPTAESQLLEDVQGTFSFFVTPRITQQERTVPLNIFSPEKEDLGPGTEFKIYRQLPNYTGGLAVPSVLDKTELTMLTMPQYVDPSREFDPSTAHFEIRALTEGAVPVCSADAFKGRVWWIDQNRAMGNSAGSPNVACKSGVMTLTVPAAMTPPPGTAGLRIEGAWVLDRPLSEYAFEYTQFVGEEKIGVERAALSGDVSGTAAGQLRAAQTNLRKSVVGASDAGVRVGQTVTYEITTESMENFRTAYGVITSDILPAGTEFISASHGGKYSSDDRTVKWPKSDYAAGETKTYTVKAKVLENAPDTLINKTRNVGENTCSPTDNAGSVCEAEATSKLVKPGMKFKKSVLGVADTNGNGLTADAGDTISYRFRLTNTGSTTETSALLTDKLLGIKDHQCLDSALPPGESVDCAGKFTHVISAAEAKVGSVKNVATLVVPELDPLEDGSVTPAYAPSISLSKTVTDTLDSNENGVIGDAGDTIVYLLRVTNTGNNNVQSVLIDDALLGVEAQECLTKPLEPRASADCVGSFEYKILLGDGVAGEVTNRAVANSPGAAETEDSVTTDAFNPAFAFDKKIVSVVDTNKNGVTGDAGDTIHYGFTVRNTGNSTLSTIVLDDPLLGVSGAECLAEPLEPARAQDEPAEVDCVGLPQFAYEITWEDDKAGVIVNNAVATSPGADKVEASAEFDVAAAPREAETLAKTGLGQMVAALTVIGLGVLTLGGSLMYRIRRQFE